MTQVPSPAVRVVSYNILADAYATQRIYPSIPPALLQWDHRRPALVERLRALRADIVCLQEVQAAHWPGFERDCAALGWHGVFARKGHARVDGCALLYKPATVALGRSETLYFHDSTEAGAAASGHLALGGLFHTVLGTLLVVSTHLRWQETTVEATAHIGYRQTSELLAWAETLVSAETPSIVCGDLNVTPAHPLLQLFAQRGYRDVYADHPQPTCAPNQRAARIDFIFASDAVTASCERLPELPDDLTLPNRAEPSDHLPISASFAISGGTSA